MPCVRKIDSVEFESIPESTVVKHPLVGSVSNGTDDTCTLIESFMDVLQAHNHPEYDEFRILVDMTDDQDMLDEILDTIYTAMESLTMDGYYFGANGNGTWNYGFWEKTW